MSKPKLLDEHPYLEKALGGERERLQGGVRVWGVHWLPAGVPQGEKAGLTTPPCVVESQNKELYMRTLEICRS